MGKALILYGQFFTRLPLPFPVADPTTTFKRGIPVLPIFGLLLGIIEAALFYGLACLFPVWLAWIGFWIIDGVLTGGFHLDALADTADGLFSSRKPERIQAIMKDSRLGTMGSLALIYFYAIVIGTGLAVIPQVSLGQLAVLAAILTMMTKTGESLLFYKLVYIGQHGGLGSIWEGIVPWRLLCAQGLSLVIIVAGLSWPGAVAYVAVLLGAFGYRRGLTRVLGGLSGDTIGAFAVLAQVIFLVVYVGLRRVIG